MGPIGCFETSVINYHYSLRNNPEERSTYLLRGGRLESCTVTTNLLSRIVNHDIRQIVVNINLRN